MTVPVSTWSSKKRQLSWVNSVCKFSVLANGMVSLPCSSKGRKYEHGHFFCTSLYIFCYSRGCLHCESFGWVDGLETGNDARVMNYSLTTHRPVRRDLLAGPLGKVWDRLLREQREVGLQFERLPRAKEGREEGPTLSPFRLLEWVSGRFVLGRFGRRDGSGTTINSNTDEVGYSDTIGTTS